MTRHIVRASFEAPQKEIAMDELKRIGPLAAVATEAAV